MQKFGSKFLVLSAPSGGGKTTIAKMLVKRHSDMSISISATTRKKRPKEEDGKDYFFLSENEFKENINNDNFVEYEEVHGDNSWATFWEAIRDYTDGGWTEIYQRME